MVIKPASFAPLVFLILSCGPTAAKDRFIPAQHLDRATLDLVSNALRARGLGDGTTPANAIVVNAEACPETCGVVDGNCTCKPDPDGKCPGKTRPSPDGICIGPLEDLRVSFGSDRELIGLSLR